MGQIRPCMSSLFALGIFFLSCLVSTGYGQTAGTSYSYTTDNDTLKIIAQADEWIGPLMSITLIFSFDSLVWQTGAYVELDDANSWFLDDGNYTHSIAVDTPKHEIRLVLNRTEEPLSGSSYLCTLTCRGITVIGDDIMRLARVSTPLFYPNPSQSYLYFTSPDEIQALDILDKQGRLIRQIRYPSSKLSVEAWPKGVYFLRYKTIHGRSIARIQVN